MARISRRRVQGLGVIVDLVGCGEIDDDRTVFKDIADLDVDPAGTLALLFCRQNV
ncbi:hypothetical protein [Methanoculleus sp. 10]|uniref:hypothetical protein n=1 Tax=Methanoculleus sp. 10 TaxID=430615 RepID=UPI0025F8E472|nr:hypothetical protein [Methanoculleus sp. 10]